MTPREIKSRLKQKQISQSELARRLGKSKTTAHLLVHRRMTSNRLEKHFARILGVKLGELRGTNGLE